MANFVGEGHVCQLYAVMNTGKRGHRQSFNFQIISDTTEEICHVGTGGVL